LSAVLVVLYLRSQHRPGVLPPPLPEWSIAGRLVCAVVVDRVRSAPSDRGIGWRPAWLMLLAAPVVACCVGCVKNVADEPYDYQMPEALVDHRGDRADLGSLPASLRLDEVDWANLGAHGNCVTVFILRGTDGASNDVVVTRLIEHFDRLGWDRSYSFVDQDGYVGYYHCRPVQGILTWDDLCLQFNSDNIDPPRVDIDRPADAVAVYIG
jgi:hypothetical protein